MLAMKGRFSLVAATGIGQMMMFAIIIVSFIIITSIGMMIHRSTGVASFLFNWPRTITGFKLANYRGIRLCIGKPVFDVFDQISEMEKSVLLLPNIYERCLNARHNSPNSTQEDIPDGAFVFLILDEKLDELTIFNNGNAGLLPFVNNNFFRHRLLSDKNDLASECSERKGR